MDKSYSVMIIDDNPVDVEITSYYLKKSGIFSDIRIASDGREAIEHFEERSNDGEDIGSFSPEVVLLDINMPHLNGFDFLDRYRALSKDSDSPTRFIMLTSSEYHEDIRRAEKNPLIHSYLTKPFTKDSIQKISNMLDS